MNNLKMQQWTMITFMLILPVLSFAQPGQGRRGDDQEIGTRRGKAMNEWRGQWMERIPNLTDAQKEEVKQIHLKAQQDMVPLRNQVNEKEAALMTLQTSQVIDMKAINKAIDELSDVKAKVQKRRAQAHQEVRKVLTDEQRVVLDMHFQNRGEGHGRGPRHGRRGK